MDQINQTNNLQQAIDKVAANKAGELGVPPMPPMEGEGVPSAAPFAAPEMSLPTVGGTNESGEPSAEQILSNSLKTDSTTTGVSTTPEIAVTETATATVTEPATEAPAVSKPEVSGDLASIRENVVKDLLPLMDKINSTPEEKFEIYKDAMKTMHDTKTIEGAYKTATQIGDENKKADALLDLMKTIDSAA